MKKITLALALLLAVGLVAATAQELTATVSGSATATIGFDLDEQSFGMINSATSDVSLTLASGSATTEMADGWYGYVSLSSWKLALDYASGADFVTWTDAGAKDKAITEDELGTADSGLIVTAPTVEAKITNGTTYVQIWALDGFVTGLATEVENDGSDISIEGKDSDIGVDLAPEDTGGFTFGTAAGPATIKVFFATYSGYDTEQPEENGWFLVGSDIGVTAGPATITFEAVRGIGAQETLGLGLKAALTAGPAAVTVAFDSQLPDGGDFDFEVRGDVGLTFGDYGVALAAFYGTDNVDVEISSSPVFGPLTLAVLFGLYDVTTDLGWGIDLGTKFAVNDMISIALDLAYDSAGVVPITFTATIADPIPNVDITAKWTTTDIAAAADNLGIFTLATKISY